jgi:hypothetical protein
MRGHVPLARALGRPFCLLVNAAGPNWLGLFGGFRQIRREPAGSLSGVVIATRRSP